MADHENLALRLLPAGAAEAGQTGRREFSAVRG
jgi:hypothetical protein